MPDDTFVQGRNAVRRSSQVMRHPLLAPAVVWLVAFVFYFLTRSASISWAVGVSDSPELSAAAYVFGVAHPPGYPLYMLLGWPVTHLPLGAEPATRLGVFSAFCGAWTAALVAIGAREGVRVAGAGRVPAALAGVVAGLGCAGLPLLWRQATAPETRTLAMALSCGVLVCLLCAWSRRDRRFLITAWLVWGMAMANHFLCLAALPALLLVSFCFAGMPRQARRGAPAPQPLWLACSLALLPGLSLYLLLPLRAMTHPPMNWGDPETPARFFWVVSTAMYRGDMGGSPAVLAGQLGDRLTTIWTSMPPPLLLAGLVGLAILALRCRLGALALALTCLASIAQSGQYSDPAAPIYVLPCEAVLCGAAAYLVGTPLLWRRGRIRRVVACALSLAALAVATWQLKNTASLNAPGVDAAARSFASHALVGLPRHAVVLATGDQDTFALWYGQVALGLRPDVAVISTDLLAWGWYRDNLEHHYPWLRWGGPWQSDANIPSLAVRQTQRQQMLVKATLGVFPLYFTAPSPGPGDPCNYELEGYLWQCVL